MTIDLKRRDRLNADAGRLARIAGPVKKQARALGVSARRIRQIIDGDHTGAPQRAIQYVDALAAHYPATNPNPFLLSLHAAVQERYAARRDMDPTLALREGLKRETALQAPADIAEFALLHEWTVEHLAELVLALELHAVSLLECIGIARVLRAQIARPQ